MASLSIVVFNNLKLLHSFYQHFLLYIKIKIKSNSTMSKIEMRKRKAAFENGNNKKRKMTRSEMNEEISTKAIENGDVLQEDWLYRFCEGEFDYPDGELIEEDEKEEVENENNKKRKMTRREMNHEISTKAIENGDDLQEDWLYRFCEGEFDYPDVELVEEEEETQEEQENKDEETQEKQEDKDDKQYQCIYPDCRCDLSGFDDELFRWHIAFGHPDVFKVEDSDDDDDDNDEEQGFVEVDGEIFIYCNCCFPPKKF